MTRTGIMQSASLATLLGMLLASLISAPPALAQKKVYRWVDEEGKVHYSETLPPNWQGETHDELRGDGLVTDEGVSHAPEPVEEEAAADPQDGKTPLPTDKSGMKRPEPLYTDAEKQQRMDRLLMLRYHSEDELIESMEIEINQLKYDERLLTATEQSLQTSLRSSIDTAGHRQRAGLEVDEKMLANIASIRAQLEENQSSLRGLEIREENIRNDFQRDLDRYRELTEMYSEQEGG